MSRLVEAAVALVVVRDRALVLRRRDDDRSFPACWCLPGGRLEPGESPRDAVVRETLEETGLALDVSESLGPRSIRAGFQIHRFAGTADDDRVCISEEHLAHRWLDRTEAAQADELLDGGLAGEVTAELLARFASTSG